MSVNPGEKLVNKELQIYYIFCLSEVFLSLLIYSLDIPLPMSLLPQN